MSTTVSRTPMNQQELEQMRYVAASIAHSMGTSDSRWRLGGCDCSGPGATIRRNRSW